MNDSYRLSNTDDLCLVIDAVSNVELNGKSIVTISERKASKSDRQRKYQWLLYNTIAKSGKGRRDSSADIDLDCKWLFREIWFADDWMLAEMYRHVVIVFPDQKKQFVEEYLHTEKLNTKQMANYLDNVISHYGHDIDLPHPEDLRLLEY